MAIKLKIKRGLEANLATAGVEAGELKYTTDGEHLYIGNGTSNVVLNDAYISVATLPATNIKTDKFYRLTAVDGTHQIGFYWYNGTDWAMLPEPSAFITKDQGTANEGKMFVINASGNAELTDTIDGGTF